MVAYDGKDPGALERRMAARAAHLALGDKMSAQGRMLYGTAILDDDQKMIGTHTEASCARQSSVELRVK